ncbi:MAG: response regulator transcription factor [Bacteroidota bacterium]
MKLRNKPRQNKTTLPKIRILLIEDNRLLREGLTSLINGYKDVLVADVSNGRDHALLKTRSVKPDLVLMDFGLASQNSLNIVQSLKKDFPAVKIIGMGLIPTQVDIMEFVQAGADGFILKNAAVEEMIKTIRIVAAGEKILPPLMTESLFFQVVEHALLSGKKNVKSAIRITEREKEIVALIVDGMSNKQIAERLNIATFTVKSHVHNILEKLALHSRLQIANFSRDEM